jgi:thiamine-phosphate pyrophosphorylase
MRLSGFYFVTDRGLSKNGILQDARQAVEAGACAVQYRDKSASTKEMLDTAFKLRKICKSIPLIINDRVDVAFVSNADGVHLGQDDMPLTLARKILGRSKIIGATAHNLQEALRAKKGGADYLGVSPIFRTRTKPDAGRPAGLEALRVISSRVDIPLVAIGGINLNNAQAVISAGADSLCAMSALYRGRGVSAAIRQFGIIMENALPKWYTV